MWTLRQGQNCFGKDCHETSLRGVFPQGCFRAGFTLIEL
ncbi:MAG: hypothetical protein SLRJCFUN_002646, partial [Candidatus Fervidibacter sp.]